MHSHAPKITSLLMTLILACLASGQNASMAAPNGVPQMISYAGVLKDGAGKVVSTTAGVTFLLYKEDQGGAPLWLETQSVSPDKSGHFTVQLGASSAHGLPSDLFQSGEARWLAVQIAGEAEQPRVLLVAVPYAMKAADAQTLGGLPASAFVLAAPANGTLSSGAAGSVTSGTSSLPPASAVTTNGGTANTLPLFSTGTDIENSAISQTGSGTIARIGIGTATPVSTLDVKGGATVRGVLSLPATGVATATAGKSSQPESFIASTFNAPAATAINQTFQWKAEPANNDTSNPSGILSLLYGSGTTAPADTGLRIGPKGIIAFAPGQTFPGGGGGSVSSVGLSAPASDFTVTGSPVTTSGTLGLNWTVAPTSANTANAIVKRDASGGFSSGSVFAVDTLGNVGVSGYSPSNYGVAGQSGSVAGVYGTSTNANGLGIFGWSQNSGDGIDGVSNSGRGMYGSVKQGQGVMGESFGTTTLNGLGPEGVVGLSHNALGHGVYAQNYDPNGLGLIALGGSAGVEGVGTSSFGVSGISTNGVGVIGSSTNGAGVSGSSTNGPAFQATGNVQQDRTSSGWMKAMVYLDRQTPPNIVRCFNSVLAGPAASIPPCGITVNAPVVGRAVLDFGFTVSDRFISVQPVELNNSSNVSVLFCLQSDGPNCGLGKLLVPNTNQVFTYSNDNSGQAATAFYLFVY